MTHVTKTMNSKLMKSLIHRSLVSKSNNWIKVHNSSSLFFGLLSLFASESITKNVEFSCLNKSDSCLKHLLQTFQSTAVPQIRIYEVGPRDGLQNESKFVPTEIKIELINKLAAAGIKDIESARYVSFFFYCLSI